MDGATSISTISPVDVDVGSFSSYIYQPTPWAKHTKTNIWGAPSLRNPSCSKLYFSPLSLAVVVAVAAALPSPAIISFVQQVEPTPARCCHRPPQAVPTSSWGDPSVAINFISDSACKPCIVSVRCYAWPAYLPSVVAYAEQKHASRHA